MALFKRIQTLFLVLFLLFTETELFVKDGAKVTLICGNVQVEQNKCNGTVWLFTSVSNSGSTEELVTLGQIGSSVKYKDRLSVTNECSLKIKPVQTQDAGLYSCRQFDKSGKQLPVADAVVHLSVVSLTEEEKEDKVELLCSVSSRLCSGLQVQWKYSGTDSDSKDYPEIKRESNDCRASVSFKTSHYFYSSRHETFKCEVSSLGQTQLFTFGPEPETTTKNPTAATEDGSKTGPGPGTQGFKGMFLLLIPAVLPFVLLLFLLIYCRKRRATNTQRATETPSEMVVYENFSPGSASGDSTYQSLCPATRDPDQVYSQLRPQPQDSE